MPYFLNPNNEGLSLVSNNKDGYSITLKWYRSFPTVISNKIAYNIYMDVVDPIFEGDFFNKSPVFVSVDGTLSVVIPELTPGQTYRFAVRPVEYDPTTNDLATLLPITFNNLRSYPETRLRSDITNTSIIIPVLSVSDFPGTGIIKIGGELIQYSSLDSLNNNFILTSASLQRGFNGTVATLHQTDGYDGTSLWDGSVLFFPIDNEDQNTVVFATQDRFDWDQYAFTQADGYRQTIKDIVNADLKAVDDANAGFPAYDYTGWHRIDPVAAFNGECVGSYFGGEMFCADSTEGVGQVLRGISIQDRNNQRQEVLLSLTGEPCVLVKRQTTGIRCFCVLPHQEIPDARCKKCFGGGFVVSYFPYFDDRNSDGKIRVRFEPWVDQLPLMDSGLEVESVKPSAWTLVIPHITARDFLIRFDREGNEEFRYEVLNVSRNILFNDQFGAQKMALQRIRKTDIIYQISSGTHTNTQPDGEPGLNILRTLTTTLNGSNGIVPHLHQITGINQNITSPNQINTLTSVSVGHDHTITNGVVSVELGHTHLIIP